MMSVGVDMTSYLHHTYTDISTPSKEAHRYAQFDDVGVAQGPHVLDLALNPGLGLGDMNDGL